ncbi:NlpC/P60 family protein [Clostridium sp. UBA1652]|uniref:C40 family peptidase n=1 Tax=Clostridium sp. UBA1652 TaxID=1946348 RepID=UPI00257C9A21|nr:C40 family peptidase [Clostridium sp. UBA1652]
MKKKAISALLIVSLLFGTGIQVLAEPLTEEQQQILDEKGEKVSEAQSKYAELQNKVDELDMQIQPIAIAVEENIEKISDANNQIESIKKQIQETKKELEEKEEIFGLRMRALYKSGGQASYIGILLSSNSLGDLIAKAQAVGKIMSLDKQIIGDLEDKQKEYNDHISNLEINIQEIELLNTDNKVKLDELNKKKEEQMVYINQAKEEYEKFASDLATTERELYKPFKTIIDNSGSTVNDLNNAISTLRELRKTMKSSDIDSELVNLIEKAKTLVQQKQAPVSTLSRGGNVAPTNSSASSSTLLSIAYSKLGAKYVYGANGPNVFDCSGFTQYVFKQVGISLSRTTFTQINDGVPVSYSDLQPGDLVFTSPGHMGIYVGGGQIIHAPQTGDVVKVSKIWSFYAARRVM